MSTIPTIQLFRNNNILDGRAAAVGALEGQKANVPDGGLILARYSGGTTPNVIKTILGIVRYNGVNSDITIFDVEGAAENTAAAITTAIGKLDKADSAVDGEYVTAVSENDGIITVTRKALPSLTTQSESGKAITAITQNNGLVNVAFGGVAAANVSVADASSAFTGNTVEAVLLEIQNSLDSAIGQGGSVGTQISNAINALNLTSVGGTGKVITTVSQANGRVSASATDLTAANVGATASSSSTTAVAVEGTTVAAQISSLATSIKSVSGAAKSYSISAITDTTEITALNLGTNVKEAYALVDEDGAQAGSTIKIYKDSSLKSVALTTGGTEAQPRQFLTFTYILANGDESTVNVDVSTFLAESEFKNGLEVVNGVVNVKIDTASEDNFLTVGADGVKLSGVQNAINTAAAKAHTVVNAKDDGHVRVAVTNDGTHDVVTVSEEDIASAALLGTADDASTKQTAFGKIANEAAVREAAIQAQRDALNAEIAARKAVDGINGDAYTAKTDANYISDATSLFNADAKLDAAIKTVATALNTETNNRTSADTALSNRLGDGVTASSTATLQLQALSGTSSDTSEATSVIGAKKYAQEYADSKIADLGATVTSVSETSKTDAITIVQTNGKISSITLGTFDCGVY